jgi:hypothetical protein
MPFYRISLERHTVFSAVVRADDVTHALRISDSISHDELTESPSSFWTINRPEPLDAAEAREAGLSTEEA